MILAISTNAGVSCFLNSEMFVYQSTKQGIHNQWIPVLHHAQVPVEFSCEIATQLCNDMMETEPVIHPDAVFCPGFQKGRVPSEKGTLAR